MNALPGLLLLHGMGDDGSCWAPFVQRLRAAPGLADLRVCTPSAPAHGGHLARPGHTIAWDDLLASGVRSAEALAEQTGAALVIGGHSMGAMMALGVAATRPDLAVGLWLEDPPMGHGLDDDPVAPEPADLSEFGAWFASLRSLPLEQVVAAARADHPTWDEAEYEPWARAKRSVDTSAFESPVPWVHDGWAGLARAVRCPAVLVAGEPSLGALVSPAAAHGLAELPGWSMHRLPVGHDVRRDAPDATVALLADLIRSLGTA